MNGFFFVVALISCRILTEWPIEENGKAIEEK